MLGINDKLHGVFADEELVALGRSAAENNFFGNGADGEVTETTRALVRDMHYTNLIVPVGVTLNTANFKIFVSGTISGAGTIVNDGPPGVADVAGVAVIAGTLGAASAGGTGNQAAGSNGVTSAVAGGGAGGIGGVGVSAAGLGGTVTLPFPGADTTLACLKDPISALSPAIVVAGGTLGRLTGGAGGGGGGGDNAAQKGGGGGAGGGIILISARTWNFTGTLAARGGVGGNGSVAGVLATGGGGGGGGGCVIRLYREHTVTPTVSVAGGAGGVKGPAAGTAGTVGFAGTHIAIPV
jgi:hypothetical protein